MLGFPRGPSTEGMTDYQFKTVIRMVMTIIKDSESKEEILQVCEEYGIPAIVALGRKGGSNVAASICNALLYMASDGVDPDKR